MPMGEEGTTEDKADYDALDPRYFNRYGPLVVLMLAFGFGRIYLSSQSDFLLKVMNTPSTPFLTVWFLFASFFFDQIYKKLSDCQCVEAPPALQSMVRPYCDFHSAIDQYSWCFVEQSCPFSIEHKGGWKKPCRQSDPRHSTTIPPLVDVDQGHELVKAIRGEPYTREPSKFDREVKIKGRQEWAEIRQNVRYILSEKLSAIKYILELSAKTIKSEDAKKIMHNLLSLEELQDKALFLFNLAIKRGDTSINVPRMKTSVLDVRDQSPNEIRQRFNWEGITREELDNYFRYIYFHSVFNELDARSVDVIKQSKEKTNMIVLICVTLICMFPFVHHAWKLLAHRYKSFQSASKALRKRQKAVEKSIDETPEKTMSQKKKKEQITATPVLAPANTESDDDSVIVKAVQKRVSGSNSKRTNNTSQIVESVDQTLLDPDALVDSWDSETRSWIKRTRKVQILIDAKRDADDLKERILATSNVIKGIESLQDYDEVDPVSSKKKKRKKKKSALAFTQDISLNTEKSTMTIDSKRIDAKSTLTGITHDKIVCAKGNPVKSTELQATNANATVVQGDLKAAKEKTANVQVTKEKTALEKATEKKDAQAQAAKEKGAKDKTTQEENVGALAAEANAVKELAAEVKVTEAMEMVKASATVHAEAEQVERAIKTETPAFSTACDQPQAEAKEAKITTDVVIRSQLSAADKGEMLEAKVSETELGPRTANASPGNGLASQRPNSVTKSQVDESDGHELVRGVSGFKKEKTRSQDQQQSAEGSPLQPKSSESSFRLEERQNIESASALFQQQHSQILAMQQQLTMMQQQQQSQQPMMLFQGPNGHLFYAPSTGPDSGGGQALQTSAAGPTADASGVLANVDSSNEVPSNSETHQSSVAEVSETTASQPIAPQLMMVPPVLTQQHQHQMYVDAEGHPVVFSEQPGLIMPPPPMMMMMPPQQQQMNLPPPAPPVHVMMGQDGEPVYVQMPPSYPGFTGYPDLMMSSKPTSFNSRNNGHRARTRSNSDGQGSPNRREIKNGSRDARNSGRSTRAGRGGPRKV